MNRITVLAYYRYRDLLDTIPKDWTKEEKTSAVLLFLDQECRKNVELLIKIDKQKKIIARANAIIAAEREGRKFQKCKPKPKSMRSPAVVKRSVRAAIAR
jgi:hypothetical protein